METTKRDPRKVNVAEMTAADLHEMAVGFGMGSHASSGEVLPTFTILNAGGIDIITAPWANDEEKNAAFGFVERKLRADKSRAYSLVHEIYVAIAIVGEPYTMPRDRPPSDREEVLMVSTFGRDGEVFISRFLITPARQGHNAKLGPRVDEPEEIARTYQGRMFNLFRPLKERMSNDPRLDADIPIFGDGGRPR